MSNKALIVSIIVIVLVFGAVVVFMRYRSNNQVNGTQQSLPSDQQAAQAPQDQPPVNPAPAQPTSTPATATSTPSTATSTQASAACQRNFDQNKLKTAKVDIKNRVVTIDVKNFGTIQLEFYPSDAPKAVENFLRLANSGYYDCLTFHRVAKGFVIQGGDPKGDGSGGQCRFWRAVCG